MKTIKFSHITKNAGTTIVHVAYENKIKWGWREKDFWKNLMCFSKYKSNAPWHLPLSFVENKDLLQEVFSQYSFFTVVRNPYERCISEYYCNFGGPEVKSDNKDHINFYIKEKLMNVKVFNYKSYHFIPQFFYVYNANNEKIIEHVLKYENVACEFDALMKKYNNKFNYIENYTNNKSLNKKFKQYDLSKENIKLIQEVYYKDFIFFNYDLEPVINDVDFQLIKKNTL